MERLIEQIELTEDHKLKLMEMAKKIFNLEHVVVCENHGMVHLNMWTPTYIKGQNMAWMEFCLLHVAKKLKIEPLWTDNIFEDIFVEAIHPVDYLYIEYSKEYK